MGHRNSSRNMPKLLRAVHGCLQWNSAKILQASLRSVAVVGLMAAYFSQFSELKAPEHGSIV
jgi:hypothetical protein